MTSPRPETVPWQSKVRWTIIRCKLESETMLNITIYNYCCNQDNETIYESDVSAGIFQEVSWITLTNECYHCQCWRGHELMSEPTTRPLAMLFVIYLLRTAPSLDGRGPPRCQEAKGDTVCLYFPIHLAVYPQDSCTQIHSGSWPQKIGQDRVEFAQNRLPNFIFEHCADYVIPVKSPNTTNILPT